MRVSLEFHWDTLGERPDNTPQRGLVEIENALAAIANALSLMWGWIPCHRIRSYNLYSPLVSIRRNASSASTPSYRCHPEPKGPTTK
jgi:hypothetical protein